MPLRQRQEVQEVLPAERVTNRQAVLVSSPIYLEIAAKIHILPARLACGGCQLVLLEIAAKSHILRRLLSLTILAIRRARRWLKAFTRPGSMIAAGAAILDLTRSKPTLVAENALLRHQLVILARAA